MLDAVMQWAAAQDAPNGLLLLAAVTSPATWSGTLLSMIEERLGDVDADPADQPEPNREVK